MSVFRSLLITVRLCSAWPPLQLHRFTAGAMRTVSWSLSDKPRADGGAQTTYEVHGATAVKATMPFAVEPQERAVRRRHQRARAPPGRRRGSRPRGHPGRIRLQPVAVSNKGAMGLMQLMPATARRAGRQQPVRPRPEHPRRRDLPEAAAEPLRPEGRTRAGRLQRRASATSKSTARCRRSRDPQLRQEDHQGRPVRAAAPKNIIYKWMEIVDGKPVMKFANKPPASGSYQIVR